MECGCYINGVRFCITLAEAINAGLQGNTVEIEGLY